MLLLVLALLVGTTVARSAGAAGEEGLLGA